MKRRPFSLRYMVLTSRLDMLWLPVAFWALFLIIARMIEGEPASFPVTTAYLGVALPMIGGIMGAYAVLEDPALELQFAAPRPAWLMLLERLGIVLTLAALCAAAYQAVLALLGIDLSPLGSLAARQLAWLVPTLAMTAFGAVTAFANRQSAGGAAFVGMVWIVQLLLRDWFLANPIGRYLLLLMGSNYPENPALRGNQVVLSLLAVLLLSAAWALLRRQERYL